MLLLDYNESRIRLVARYCIAAKRAPTYLHIGGALDAGLCRNDGCRTVSMARGPRWMRWLGGVGGAGHDDAGDVGDEFAVNLAGGLGRNPFGVGAEGVPGGIHRGLVGKLADVDELAVVGAFGVLPEADHLDAVAGEQPMVWSLNRRLMLVSLPGAAS